MSVWTPRPDQQDVLDFLETRERAAVYSPTGGGKTAIAATWLYDLMYDRCVLPRVLIVAPKLVAQSGWTDQFAKWDHLQGMLGDTRVLTFGDLDLTPSIGPGGRRGPLTFRDRKATKKHLLGMRERIHIASWDAFPHLVKAYGANWPYQGLVPDEASFFRDQMSERTKAARYVVHSLGAVQFQLQLTGTPNSNHGDAIFPQVNLLSHGLLGRTLTEFRDLWCVPDSRNWSTGQVYSWKINPAKQDALNALVANVAVSVPSALATPLLEVDQGVDMPETARAAYDLMERTWVWDGVAAGSEAVLHGKLRQMANGFVYDAKGKPLFLHNSKIERLVELVESISTPVLVGYEFEEELARIRGAFGKHARDIRETGAKAAFLAGKLKVLAVHPASAGHGIDGLQGVTNQMIWVNAPQVREFYDQLNGRIHRTGTQAETVYCHRLYARKTREERILTDVLPGKLTLAQAFLNGVRVAPGKDGNGRD